MLEGRSFLIVEDEPVTAAMIRSDIESWGGRVIGIADNSARALEILADNQADCVIIDIELPGDMDGIQTAELIRKQHDLALIFLTAYSNELLISRAEQVFPHAYILKPYRSHDLYINLRMAKNCYNIESELRAVNRNLEQEIREHRRTAQALRESEEKFRTLFYHTGDAQLLMDNDTVLDCNEAALTLFGCSDKNTLVGHSIFEFGPDHQLDGIPSRQKGLQVLSRALRDERVFFEWLHWRVDGTPFNAEVMLTRIVVHGKGYVHATVRDITERKRLQTEFIKMVDSAQQRIGRDLHDDLGQDLTALAFLCNSLRQDLAERGAAEADQAQEIMNEVYRVITKVRTISRELYPANLIENEIVSYIAAMANAVQSRFGIECVFELKHDFRITNPHAAGQLYYVVREAVTNAIRHGNPKRILISLTAENDVAIILIADDGIGLQSLSNDGIGIRIMAYRIESIQGSCILKGNDWGGVTVECRIPISILTKWQAS